MVRRRLVTPNPQTQRPGLGRRRGQRRSLLSLLAVRALGLTNATVARAVAVSRQATDPQAGRSERSAFDPTSLSFELG